MRCKTLLVDANNALHRSLFTPARKGEVSEDGELVGGVFGFLTDLQSWLILFEPSVCVCIWDGGLSSRRKELYPEYKVRKEIDEGHREAFADQKSKLLSLLPMLGVSSFSLYGREADDVLYVASVGAARPAVIVSDDADLFQCVDSGVSVHRPITGRTVTYESFLEHVGVPIDTYASYKALVGDASDNIKGVPGIGKVTAKKIMMKRFNSLVSLREAAASVGGRAKNLLEGENSKLYDRNVELIDIRCEEFTVAEKMAVQGAIQAKGRELRMAYSVLSLLGFEPSRRSWTTWALPFRRLA